jgi:hypothetical protein
MNDMGTRKTRRSAYVPRLVLRGAAVVSVIPACAVLACGGAEAPGPSADAGADAVQVGVAAVAYPAYESGVPDARLDAPFSVAAVAYPAYESGAPDGEAGADANADAGMDAFFGVAAVAYPAYEAGNG